MSFIDYFAFAARHRRFLAFGFLLTLTSSAGQTFFIGLFGPAIRTSFDLDHTEWGSLYLVGTLASALVLPWSGQLIDRVDLRLYVTIVLLGLASACFAMTMAHSVAVLAFAIFLLRQLGQGLTSHAAATSMARYHGPDRGKALAIASTGMAVGEATLPFLAVLAIAAFGWRETYGWAGLAIMVVLLPASLWLLGDHKKRHEQHLTMLTKPKSTGPSPAHDSTRLQALSEWRFYVLLPAFIAPPFIMTALFFHHLTLADEKGWSAMWMTGHYWVFALCSMLASLASGPLIDRFTAKRIMPLFLLPLTAALFLLTPAETALWLLPYLALLGLTSGMAFTGFSALWAELYGATHLGAIRSLTSAIGVFASALGPVTLGLFLDADVAMDTVCLGFAGYSLVATLLLIQALRPSAYEHRPKACTDAR